ncbi:serine hydrolase domain-containing protein [Rhizobium leguminosarum]|uniref:Class C beta-lactamase-related serine hydrolase n=1 Tax=Rhizobium leguminosarum TaxID=384 RepID=A0ABD7PYN9_RHILE|nr:serine hydrolase [Rhizobium leguminosarum]NZD53794.1 serine hydrolase [Rhizobium leguminosarum]TAV76570.1 class C beta-lactamase-related serine hydrolase [Rhizobium leguminosarum]TAV81169.1 class C beta-lactamase-related serine hydrolase [Rhizobium leguminosarum]TAW32517.1 class C beta-lactamase-related serine hydrolase [Rhizobium leguminosarum]TAW46250.1 class C beta-lactamase-related serine hydrolase [Rhizobium leguminosarum]
MIRILPLLLLLCLPLAATGPAAAQSTASAVGGLGPRLDRAASDPAMRPLKTVIVARDGRVLSERGFRGHSPSESTNIKSASKSIISALVGIAIDKGLLEGPDQKIAPILKADLPVTPDPRINDITIGNLLSMQAGLDRMSGANYGRWVSSRNWVRFALSQPFVDQPGGEMLYSTASTHLLSAILTKVGRRPTLVLAREWLGPVDGFRIGAWERDPQGIYLGGNQMAMSARSLLAFGELYRNGGKTADGRQIVPADWISQSWQQRTNSRFSGDEYGYGWFTRQIGGEQVHFAWGYGGQMLYIVPSLDLTVVMTSEESGPSARNGYRDLLHGLLADIIGAVRAA